MGYKLHYCFGSVTSAAICLSLLLLCPWSPKAIGAESEVLDALREKHEETQSKPPVYAKSRFSPRELRLDLPSDTVLASLNGEPLLSVDEFNQRAKSARGSDLYEARYNALRKIVDRKLVAAVAKEEGFENDQRVRERIRKEKSEINAALIPDQYAYEITDVQAENYYRENMEQFRQPDKATRVLFVVKAELSEALKIQTRIDQGEAFSKFSFSQKPLPGSQLPPEVQEAIFHLEPGEHTEVVWTPIGVYIAQLAERNDFDHFKVSVILRSNVQECEKLLEKITKGEEFEKFVAEEGHLAVDMSMLPKETWSAIRDLGAKSVSEPIPTSMGYFLVKLQESWSDADILRARVIRVGTKEKAQEILDRLGKGLSIGSVQERVVAGKDLPAEVQSAARGLRVGVYSPPLKASLGYYLVKVEKRAREKYKPFRAVKEDIKKLLKGESITDEEAYTYYKSHASNYSKAEPDYMVSVILCETHQEGERILAALSKAPDGKKKDSLFVEHQKDLLQPVSAALLPAPCKTIASKLNPGQLSQVVSTPIGYFILKLHAVEDPAYLAFEDVKDDIKSLLAEQKIRQAQTTEHRNVKISLSASEENALAHAYHQTYLANYESVSDEEAEAWWQQNKDDFFAALGLQGTELKFDNPRHEVILKKGNVLLRRYQKMIEDLYDQNNVIIHEEYLSY